MGLARTYSAVVVGVRAHIVEVEAHLSAGLPSLTLVGLPDTSLNEARDRVRAAMVNSGLKWPDCRITVGLSPAWLPKRGSGLDVAIALAILAADGQVPHEIVTSLVSLGELGLDGRIRPVAGALAAALALRRLPGRKADAIVAGPEDGRVLQAVPETTVLQVASLRALVARLRGEQEPDEVDRDLMLSTAPGSHAQRSPMAPMKDMAEVRGQDEAKFGLEVAAAGGHHVALLGRAGVGKTLLAERLPGLLPDLPDEPALEVTAIHQLTGKFALPEDGGLIRRPPWFAPHHTASRVAMVGGGTDDRPSIGMVSLAHHGVLFLDEAAEFEPAVTDALREPLESGSVSIARAGFHLTFPARFQLLIATNPCPCGNALDTHRGAICRCTPAQRRRYLARLSGPLLDRVDLRVVLRRPTLAAMASTAGAEPSSAIATRVANARSVIRSQLAGTGWTSMIEVPTEELLKRWPLSTPTWRELDLACRNDSLRGRDRVVRVAWTLAALGDRGEPNPADIATAVRMRASQSEWAA
jgi:magnesium chelatase family protein